MNIQFASFLVLGLAIASGLSFCGCIGEQEEGAEPSREVATLTVAGSTTVMPLVETCAEQFNKMQTDMQVSVTGGGSGVGIKNVATGLSDLAMTSRQVKASEIEAYGDKFEEFLVAYDAIALVVSRAVYDAGITELNRSDVMAIYNGDITNWEALGGPDERIYVVAREAGSGTRDTFNKMVIGSEEAETLGVVTYHGSNAEMKTAITGSDKAIGYVGLNYIEGGKLHVIAYEGVEPSEETIRNGSYPLARELYMYSWGKPSENAQKFLDFILSEEGQAVVQKTGFVPVR